MLKITAAIIIVARTLNIVTMSFQTLVDYMYDKLTLNDSSGAIIHSVFFIIFANWAMQRYAWNFIEHLGVNVRPWLRVCLLCVYLKYNTIIFTTFIENGHYFVTS